MHVFCIVLSLISIFYFSIHVIFSYSAFRLQDCSIKSVNQSTPGAGCRGGSSPSILEGQLYLWRSGWSSKNFVSYVYKYAVFDTKPTYYRYTFIPDVQLHSPKISFGEGVVRADLTEGVTEPPLGRIISGICDFVCVCPRCSLGNKFALLIAFEWHSPIMEQFVRQCFGDLKTILTSIVIMATKCL